MTEEQVRMVMECFALAFGGGVDPAVMGDAELAAFLGLQARVAGDFGLYVLADSGSGLEAADFQAVLNRCLSVAVARMGRCPDLRGRVLFVGALSDLLRRVPVGALSESRGFGDEVAGALVRFVEDAAASRCDDEVVRQAAVRAFDALQPWLAKAPVAKGRVAAMRKYVVAVLRGWCRTMNQDGSWDGVTDGDAVERAALLSGTAISGVRIGAEMIDRCYLRYVMKDEDGALPAVLGRMEARCVHYTDIEAECAAADLAILGDALGGELTLAGRLEACSTLYNVMLQLFGQEAEVYGLMPVDTRRLYNAVVASHAYESMTDEELLAIAGVAGELTDALWDEAYDSVYLEELAIGPHLIALCDELAERSGRQDVNADTRKEYLRLLENIGYGPDNGDCSGATHKELPRA